MEVVKCVMTLRSVDTVLARVKLEHIYVHVPEIVVVVITNLPGRPAAQLFLRIYMYESMQA